jgi:hypothetical protein
MYIYINTSIYIYTGQVVWHDIKDKNDRKSGPVNGSEGKASRRATSIDSDDDEGALDTKDLKWEDSGINSYIYI